MNAKQLRQRLLYLADRLHDGMDDADVSHRLRLLEPGIAQLELVVDGLESKVSAVAEHRAGTQPTKPRTRAAKH